MTEQEDNVPAAEQPVEEKPEEKAEETPSATASDKIEQANKAAERLEKANEEKERLLIREEALRAQDILGGKSTAGQEKPKEKEKSPEETANELFAGNKDLNPLK